MFVIGVLGGMATAALIWLGLSSAMVVFGFGILLLLMASLSSAIGAIIAGDGGDPEGGEASLRKGRER